MGGGGKGGTGVEGGTLTPRDSSLTLLAASGCGDTYFGTSTPDIRTETENSSFGINTEAGVSWRARRCCSISTATRSSTGGRSEQRRRNDTSRDSEQEKCDVRHGRQGLGRPGAEREQRPCTSMQRLSGTGYGLVRRARHAPSAGCSDPQRA